MTIRIGKISSVSKEVFNRIVSESRSYSEMLRKLGLSTKGASNHNRLKQRIIEDEINVDHLLIINGRNMICNTFLTGKKKVDLKEVLVENCNYSRGCLKRRLIKEGYLDYKCKICGCNEWMGQLLILRLDHENGIHNDNRLENLRLLCPNCDSQQVTYAGKNRKKLDEKKYKCLCGEEKSKKSEVCDKCSRIHSRKVIRPIKEILSKLIWEIPTTKIASQYGVSDKAVEKWIKSYELNKPPRGYWQKQNKCMVNMV